MKKIILASVALIAVFASCKKEDIRTVYKAEPAKATITVEVYDALYGQNVTSQANITANAGTVEGTQVVLVGDQANNYAIPEQKVTISAEFSGRKGSVTMPVSSLVEGGVASYSAVVVVGSPVDPKQPIDYEIVENDPSDPVTFKTWQLEKATHSHAGANWVINNTEFFIYGTTKYNDVVGFNEEKSKLNKLVPLTDDEDATAELLFNLLIAVNPEKSTEKELEYHVSAFSYFNVIVENQDAVQHFDLCRVLTLVDGSKESVRIADMEMHITSTKVSPVEMASPDHASHYVAGHGVDDAHWSHAHGYGGYNAGGGIVVAD